ncbi:MAG TPA: hypothetical protein VHX39_36915, partial [Acetobacteraceae bacterium]|nr:hypothetical protein [Acetobacteraceae bacterium]
TYWGDVAGAVAQEASGGINAVVERFIDSNKNAQQNAGAPGPPAEGSGPAARGAADGGPASLAGPVPNNTTTALGSAPTSKGSPVPGTPKQSVLSSDGAGSGAPAKPAATK